MLNRRTFLLTSLAATAGMLSSCSSSQDILDIILLQGSIPPQLIGDFRKTIGKLGQIKLHPEIQLQTIFELLEAGQQSEAEKDSIIDSLPIVGQKEWEHSNLVTLGDYWLQNAIANNLIQPIDSSNLEKWDTLPAKWQNLVKRDSQGNLNPQGKVYGAPYRWGNTVIAYRQDKLDWIPTNWSDLWRKEVTGRISLLDDYREVIGLTLKKLGHSYNTTNLSQVPNLATELQQLQQQVKFYSSDKYLQPLVLGDTWLAVGWSTDILDITKRHSNIAIAVPSSGTSLWADIWVQPNFVNNTNTTNEQAFSSLAKTWIDFCWGARSAQQILLFTNAISPILTAEKTEALNLIEDLAKNQALQSTLANFDNSEFLSPLSPEITTEYINLWKQIRNS